MEAIHSRLDEIIEKAEYLAERTQSLAQENQRLNARIAALESDLNDRTGELEDLRKQHEVLSLARNIKGDAAPDQSNFEELRERIDEYIREIDQCLKVIGD